MNKTIYVRNEVVWNKAKGYAAEDGISMSELIRRLLVEVVQKGVK